MGLLTDAKEDCIAVIESLMPVVKMTPQTPKDTELKSIATALLERVMSYAEKIKQQIAISSKPKSKEQELQEKIRLLNLQKARQEREREQQLKQLQTTPLTYPSQKLPSALTPSTSAQLTLPSVKLRSKAKYEPCPGDTYYTKLAKQMRAVEDIVKTAEATSGRYVDDVFAPDISSILGGGTIASLEGKLHGMCWLRPEECISPNVSLFGSAKDLANEVIQGSIGDCWLLYAKTSI